jgi:hypothetical protein
VFILKVFFLVHASQWLEWQRHLEIKRQEVGENCIMRSFITWYSLPSIIRMVKEDEMGREWRRRGMHVGFWWGSQKELDH